MYNPNTRGAPSAAQPPPPYNMDPTSAHAHPHPHPPHPHPHPPTPYTTLPHAHARAPPPYMAHHATHGYSQGHASVHAHTNAHVPPPAAVHTHQYVSSQPQRPPPPPPPSAPVPASAPAPRSSSSASAPQVSQTPPPPNSITLLNQLLSRAKLPHHTQKLERIGGKDHNPVFEVQCTWKFDVRPPVIFRYRAGSKANAKRGAAYVLLTALREHVNNTQHHEEIRRIVTQAWRNIEDAAIRAGLEADKIVPEDEKQDSQKESSQSGSRRPQRDNSKSLTRGQEQRQPRHPHPAQPPQPRHTHPSQQPQPHHPHPIQKPQRENPNQAQEPYPQSHYQRGQFHPQTQHEQQYGYPRVQNPPLLTYVIDTEGLRNSDGSSTRGASSGQNKVGNFGQNTASPRDSGSSLYPGSSHSRFSQEQGQGERYSGDRWYSPSNRGHEQYRHRSDGQRGSFPPQPQPEVHGLTQYNNGNYSYGARHYPTPNAPIPSNAIRSAPVLDATTRQRNSNSGSGSGIVPLKSELLAVSKPKPKRPSFGDAKLGQDRKPLSTNTSANPAARSGVGGSELPTIPRKPSETSRDPRLRRQRPNAGTGTTKVKKELRMEQSNRMLYEHVVRGTNVKIEKQSPVRKQNAAAPARDVQDSPASVKKISLVPASGPADDGQVSSEVTREQPKSMAINSSHAAREQAKNSSSSQSVNEQKKNLIKVDQVEKVSASETAKNTKPDPPKPIAESSTAKVKVSAMKETNFAQESEEKKSKVLLESTSTNMKEVEASGKVKQISLKASIEPGTDTGKEDTAKEVKSTGRIEQSVTKSTVEPSGDIDKVSKEKEVESTRCGKESVAKQAVDSETTGERVIDLKQDDSSKRVQGKAGEIDEPSEKATLNGGIEMRKAGDEPNYPNPQGVLVTNKDNGSQQLNFPTISVAVGGTDSTVVPQDKPKEVQKDPECGDVQKDAPGSILKETGKNEKSSDVSKKDGEKEDAEELKSPPVTPRAARAQRRRTGLDFVPRLSPRRSSVAVEDNLKKRPRPSLTEEVETGKPVNGTSKESKAWNSGYPKRVRQSLGRKIVDSDDSDSEEVLENGKKKMDIADGKQKKGVSGSTITSPEEKSNVEAVATPLKKSSLIVMSEDESAEDGKQGANVAAAPGDGNVAANRTGNDESGENSEMVAKKAALGVATDSSMSVAAPHVPELTHQMLEGVSIRSTILGYRKSPSGPLSPTNNTHANGIVIRPVKKRPRIYLVPERSHSKYQLNLYASLVEESVYELILGSSYGSPSEVELTINLYSNHGAKKKHPRLRTTKNRTVNYFEQLKTTEGGLRCAIMADAAGKMVELIRGRADAKLDPSITEGIDLEFSRVVVVTNHSDLFARGNVEIVKANELQEYLAEIQKSFVCNRNPVE